MEVSENEDVIFFLLKFTVPRLKIPAVEAIKKFGGEDGKMRESLGYYLLLRFEAIMMQPTQRSRHQVSWIEMRAQEQLSRKQVGAQNSRWMAGQEEAGQSEEGWSNCRDCTKGDRSQVLTQWYPIISVLQKPLSWFEK